MKQRWQFILPEPPGVIWLSGLRPVYEPALSAGTTKRRAGQVFVRRTRCRGPALYGNTGRTRKWRKVRFVFEAAGG